MSCARKNFRSRFSCPTRIHSITSTCCSGVGSVSSVNAAAIIFFTPAFRAESANSRGYTPLPATIPRTCSGACAKQRMWNKRALDTSARTIVLPVATAFDVQLGERFLQRRLYGSHLFRSLVFFHRRFCALDRDFRGSDVDFFGFQCHVGQDRHCIGPDLYKTLTDGQRSFASVFYDAQFARYQGS